MQDIASFNELFDQVIAQYHRHDEVDRECDNPYKADTLAHLLFQKCWIDTVQWHLEDIIRDPAIDPVKALEIKRRIDASNQERTDLVERIDDFYMDAFKDAPYKKEAKINTESPAWAIDRLSILALKIYHMNEQATRKEVGKAHKLSAQEKLKVLWIQRQDLTQAISELISDIRSGNRIMKVYRQMKMYNDPSLNPVLYGRIK